MIQKNPSIESPRVDRKILRRGWTTGACATAAAKAACVGLISGTIPDYITAYFPCNISHIFSIKNKFLSKSLATASVIKDAGDDPDITHGAEIIVDVAQAPDGHGLVFQAGSGVGLVTRPGLALAVGEPAINYSPRAMIAQNIAFARHIFSSDLLLTVSIKNGLKLSKYTFNKRLGIIGGLSVLGTTGVVIPYSCSAWVTTIQRGIDIARAAGITHIAGATGRTSERAVQRLLCLPDIALIAMGDFVGALLHYLRNHPLPHLTLAGGFAKLAKLARGALDLHSGRCSFDPSFLAQMARNNGASPALTARLCASESANHAMNLARKEDMNLAVAVAREARKKVKEIVGSAVSVNVVIFDRDGTLLTGETPGREEKVKY